MGTKVILVARWILSNKRDVATGVCK